MSEETPNYDESQEVCEKADLPPKAKKARGKHTKEQRSAQQARRRARHREAYNAYMRRYRAARNGGETAPWAE